MSLRRIAIPFLALGILAPRLAAAEDVFTPLVDLGAVGIAEPVTRRVGAGGALRLGFGPPHEDADREDHQDIVGDGNVFSTVGDLARWDANFYEPKVGGPALLDALRTEGRTVGGKPTGYGRGLFVDAIAGMPGERHNGAGGGYRIELLRFPSERTSVAVLCNRYDAEVEDLADAVAGALLPKLAAVPSLGVAPSPTPLGRRSRGRRRADRRHLRRAEHVRGEDGARRGRQGVARCGGRLSRDGDRGGPEGHSLHEWVHHEVCLRARRRAARQSARAHRHREGRGRRVIVHGRREACW